VTTPYQQPRYVGRRAPWGPVHVRRDGSAYTACGQPTAGWFVFWDLTVNLDSPVACRACADSVRSQQQHLRAG
jgi:queuine/archaeosine tRNA-ribosyltransferase